MKETKRKISNTGGAHALVIEHGKRNRSHRTTKFTATSGRKSDAFIMVRRPYEKELSYLKKATQGTNYINKIK